MGSPHSSARGKGRGAGQQSQHEVVCHRHGRLYDYHSTLFFYFAKSNSFPHSLILSLFLSYLFT